MISLQEALVRKNRNDDKDDRDYISGGNLLEFLEIKSVDNGFVVDTIHDKYITIFLNQKAQSISNDLFTWGNIHGCFICDNNRNLISFKGSPKICDDFCCVNCENLKTLKGAPKVKYIMVDDENDIEDYNGLEDKICQDIN